MLKSYRLVSGWWPIRFYCHPQSQLAIYYGDCFGFMNGLGLELRSYGAWYWDYYIQYYILTIISPSLEGSQYTYDVNVK